MRHTGKNQITVGFIGLGCPKNTVDGERILAEIAEAGFVISGEPYDADVVIINTCGFIAPAKAESLEAIRRGVERKIGGPVKKVIVTGCLSERLGEQIFDEVAGVDAVIGLGQRDNIADIIEEVFSSGASGAYMEGAAAAIHDDRGRLLVTPGHWAYLRISEGCNHHCSFCTIPSIRGRFRSKPRELVLAEAAELVRAGAVELNVIAQDTTCYGRDLKIKGGLAGLLRELEGIEGLAWIRLMYMYPDGIDQRLLETVADSGKVVHYFDIPIQHVNSRILRAMRRRGGAEGMRRLIEKLRAAIPDIILRTTLIIGFPGESEQEYAELLEFVRWARFDALGCFKFYPEPGTVAAEMRGQIPDEVKEARVEELMLVQQGIAFASNEKRIGGRVTCLVDSVDSKRATGVGRFYGQAPDIDSACLIENCRARAGEFIRSKVVGTRDYDLIIRQIGS
ncbi:MAG: 30S ribosomal protein S12 methylthiotransferase RimO [Phycisphaerales bacterium]|nr:MAG: 30S ribosomal protein S12 methylthiotransferase RimO [Phycisphaerales bacterium]